MATIMRPLTYMYGYGKIDDILDSGHPCLEKARAICNGIQSECTKFLRRVPIVLAKNKLGNSHDSFDGDGQATIYLLVELPIINIGEVSMDHLGWLIRLVHALPKNGYRSWDETRSFIINMGRNIEGVQLGNETNKIQHSHTHPLAKELGQAICGDLNPENPRYLDKKMYAVAYADAVEAALIVPAPYAEYYPTAIGCIMCGKPYKYFCNVCRDALCRHHNNTCDSCGSHTCLADTKFFGLTQNNEPVEVPMAKSTATLCKYCSIHVGYDEIHERIAANIRYCRSCKRGVARSKMGFGGNCYPCLRAYEKGER